MGRERDVAGLHGRRASGQRRPFDATGADGGCPACGGAHVDRDVDSGNYALSENGGTGTIVVLRTGDASGTLTVQYGTSNGTATTDDYTGTSGLLTFGPAATRQTFAVTIADDAEDEGDETFLLHLTNPSPGAVGEPAAATFTILDNDGAGTRPTRVGFRHRDRGRHPRRERAAHGRRGRERDGPVRHERWIGHGRDDYVATSGVLSFGPSESARTIGIVLQDDAQADPDETFQLTLSHPTGGAVLGPLARTTLTLGDRT